MLSVQLKTALLCAVAIYFIILAVLLKQKRLALRYTLLWMFSGLLMLLVTLFPQVLTGITHLLGIQLLSNALFAILFFCGLLILMSLTTIISKQGEQIKRLAQHAALMEKRLKDLETQRKESPCEGSN